MRVSLSGAWLAFLTVAQLHGCASAPSAASGHPPVPPAAEETSVKPGINDHYFEPESNARYVRLLEAETREIVQRREEIVDALNLREGMEVADIGAGTGVLTTVMAERVGDRGTVYAVDIVPSFLERIRRRVDEAGLGNVVVVHGEERATGLPPASLDLALMCDTYHHIEYPKSYLRSVLESLRGGGAFVVIDMKRKEGASPVLLNHVRADKQTVVDEIEEAGFALEKEIDLLRHNYYLWFRRP